MALNKKYQRLRSLSREAFAVLKGAAFALLLLLLNGSWVIWISRASTQVLFSYAKKCLTQLQSLLHNPGCRNPCSMIMISDIANPGSTTPTSGAPNSLQDPAGSSMASNEGSPSNPGFLVLQGLYQLWLKAAAAVAAPKANPNRKPDAACGWPGLWTQDAVESLFHDADGVQVARLHLPCLADTPATAGMSSEVEAVLALLEQASGGTITRSQVVLLERVQNLRLWTAYCRRRKDLEIAHGNKDLNERHLFHGTDCCNARAIFCSGFDHTRTHRNAPYGAGIYFTDRSNAAANICTPVRGSRKSAAARTLSNVGSSSKDNAPAASRSSLLSPAGTNAGTCSSSSSSKDPTCLNDSTPFVATTEASSGVRNDPVPGTNGSSASTSIILVTRVLLGKQTPGYQGLQTAPKGYDSVTGGNVTLHSEPLPALAGGTHLRGRQPYCHVVFDADMAYPEYAVTLKL